MEKKQKLSECRKLVCPKCGKYIETFLPSMTAYCEHCKCQMK